MDFQVMAHMEMVHLNLMMTADAGSRFSSMPEERQRQADAALWIRWDIKKATPALLDIMTKTDEFGYWAYHAKEMTFGRKPNNYRILFKHTAKAIIFAWPKSSQRDYQKSFLKTFLSIEKSDGSVRQFMKEFVFQAMRSKNPLLLKHLLWKLPGDFGDYERAQGELLRAFEDHDRFVEFMTANASPKLLGQLALKHTLGSLARYGTRKDRVTLLSDQLGV